MGSFGSQQTYEGHEVWDNLHTWWARDEENTAVWWADSNGPDGYTAAPWPHPEVPSDPMTEPNFEGAIKETGGAAYQLDVQKEVTLPEGVMFFNDPQLAGVGMVWSLFDPAKEIVRPKVERGESL